MDFNSDRPEFYLESIAYYVVVWPWIKLQLLVQAFSFVKWDCCKNWENTCKIDWKGSIIILAVIIKSRNTISNWNSETIV